MDRLARNRSAVKRKMATRPSWRGSRFLLPACSVNQSDSLQASMLNTCRFLLAPLMFVFMCIDALAQSYPTKTVRVIVPTGGGGGADAQGRLMSKRFSESMGQPFVVDNRPGAAGIIGA